jgi:hypothetical protein
MQGQVRIENLTKTYLSPASKFANLLSRICITLFWTGLLCVMSGG